MFYEFRQNNSGGSFEIDERAGISVHVIVEADDLSEAVDRACRIGLYFDGIENGYDCECCGDRWYEPWGPGDAVPSHYGEPIEEVREARRKKNKPFQVNWAGESPDTFIHYKDGTVEAVPY